MQSLLGRSEKHPELQGNGCWGVEGAGVAARGIAGTLQDVFDVHCSG